MNIQECYEFFGGNYAAVRSRLPKDDMIKRFLLKFLDDKTCSELSEAMENKDYDTAFRAAHTLKGVSQNLDFERLSKSASELTETLRNRETAPVDENIAKIQWEKVKEDYSIVVEAIRRLE